VEYVGILTQQRRNNFRSLLLLVLFPGVILGLTWVFFRIYGVFVFNNPEFDMPADANLMEWVNQSFLTTLPIVVFVCLVWFLIAYFANTAIISRSTGSKPLERKENKRIYNLVENLCIASNMDMPKINVIEDDSLNAFASGIDKKSYTVTLSRGIIDKLNDEELEGVIAHELTHIRNKDVRLLIISIVFVGIFSFISQFLLRSMFHMRVHGSSRGGKNSGGSTALIMLLILVLSAIGYMITMLMRFAISRKREYMADAGGAEMTHKPWALASALRKISADSRIEAVEQKDVAQLFIDNPLKKGIKGASNLFATHPPIDKRIQILEQF
jgi:heat shock protein HtpX